MRTALKHSFAVIIADVTQADACRDIGVPLPHSGAKVIPGPGIDLAKLEAAEMPDMSDGVRIFIDSDGPPERQRETIEAIAADMGASAGQVTFKAATSSSASIEAAPPDISAPADATELAGRDEHVKRGLRDAHIHVQLAAAQVFPAPLMYALAIGRPVLALDTPAYRRTIDERVNGILLPAAEPAAVAAGIRDMLGRPDLLTSMARASRAKAERRFDAARLSGAVLDALMMQ